MHTWWITKILFYLEARRCPRHSNIHTVNKHNQVFKSGKSRRKIELFFNFSELFYIKFCTAPKIRDDIAILTICFHLLTTIFKDSLEKYMKSRITLKKLTTKIFNINFRNLEFSSERRGTDSIIHCYKKIPF